MFHILEGSVEDIGNRTFIRNQYFGIEVQYDGAQDVGTFHITPLFDQNNSKWKFYAFDSVAQRDRFESILKIQGIGGKTAYHIAVVPQDKLREAVEEFDAQFFQKIPGVGPKTAKRLLVELKGKVSQGDMEKLSVDEKIAKDIVASLKSLGYSAKDVKDLLPKVPYDLEEDNMPKIMKWLIDHL